LEKGGPAPAIDLETATKVDPVRAAEQAAVERVTPAPVERPAGQTSTGPPDRDGRDRRGRRPRRRRGKGRGFPDSKYASPSAAVEPRRDSVPSEVSAVNEPPEAMAVEEEEEELPVLPGESISKYADVGQVDNLPLAG